MRNPGTDGNLNITNIGKLLVIMKEFSLASENNVGDIISNTPYT